VTDVPLVPKEPLESLVHQGGPAQTLNIHQRIHAVMSELEAVSKDRQNQQFKYKFVGHDDVMGPLRRALVTHGIVQKVSVEHFERRPDQSIGVKCLIAWANIDNPEDAVAVFSWGEACSTQRSKDGEAKGDDVQLGKAVSYAVKYAQLKNFCLVGGGIPDNEEEHAPPEKRREAYSAPRPDPVADDQVALYIQQYKACQTRKEVEELTAIVSPLVNARKITEDQETRLARAYDEAMAEVKS
jgi:hypothetical protein